MSIRPSQPFTRLYDQLVDLFSKKEDRKDLISCNASVYTLFENTLSSALQPNVAASDLVEHALKSNAVIDYCNESILTFHFKDVPFYWRRMLMDGALLQALIQLRSILLQPNTNFGTLEPLVQKIMSDLDTSSIVSGSPGVYRRAISETILDELQAFLTNQRCDKAQERIHKKSKLDHWNNTHTSEQPPCIQYPILRLKEPPSFSWFVEYCNKENPTPFIIPKGAISDWPAFSEPHAWKSTEYLLSVAADRTVPVEIGSQYTDANWGQKMMLFSDFINDYIVNGNKPTAYLAQHDLFYQIPRLERDIAVPDYCHVHPQLNELYTNRPDDVIKNAWFGPKGTVSPLHHDPYHNLLAQVVGSKYLRLISPAQTAFVYPREGIMSNTSQVDVEHPDNKKYPSFRDVHYIECLLEEGELLYIPPKWWHFVKSLEASFSVSLWF